eukprot:CAMPEP_0179124252 /NCGR_PEP_ID=MMETSP0796-20121207/58710_1 /TAXON_ID=73915 /ORGANISM="Pyrodinium bahamense, Strain pbaha01" /LENGTH=348 /DNA_ID=CAMNT_0020822909 /DNA_START=45 /DNA_END=1091 /DNA_ORIENTATION=-
MTASMKLRVKLSAKSLAVFDSQGIDVPWDEEQVFDIQCPEPPLTIEDVSIWIEARIEGLYYQQTGGEDRAQVQIRSIRPDANPDNILAWGDHADQFLKPGDKIIIDAIAQTASMAARRRPQFSEEDLKRIRGSLRFDLNDRVLCYCGPRWFSGHVVGTAVQDDEGDLLPYLVKTDPLPGLPSRTISVPGDRDEICTQEVCFNPKMQLHLVKAAALLVPSTGRPKLRFGIGAKVTCRIVNAADGLEQWVSGTVSEAWPKLPGELKWQIEDVSGDFPDVVPYKVDLSTGSWVYCHRDHHTLIRREGMEPQTRVKGISKRMELRRTKDGEREQVDHQTERRKRALDSESED